MTKHQARSGRSALRYAVQRNAKAVIALAIIWVTSFAVGGYIVAHQRIHLPAWVPFVGQKDFIIKAPIQSVAGVLPGQGQAVTISGVRVGDIAGVDLVNGRAVARLRIQPKYAHIYPNATVLMRPKTGLKDMVAEVDPGSPSSGHELKNGAELSIGQTKPTVDLDEILAALDTDTRQSLQMLVGGGAQALGNGRDLADTLRRFAPLSEHVATASRFVVARQAKLKRLMHNLSLLASELGSRDRQLARFVQGSEGVFRHFANQNQHLSQAIGLLPGALSAGNQALARVNVLGQNLHTTLTELDPAARALAPTLRETRPFLRATTPVFKNQLRPFAVAAQPTAKLLVPAARDLADATPGLKTLADVLDAIVNELAYKPAGQQSTLFYVPWASHDTNSVISNQDGIGPLRRGLVLLSCGSLQFIESQATPKRNPTLSTLIQLLNAPSYSQFVSEGKCPKAQRAAAPSGGGR